MSHFYYNCYVSLKMEIYDAYLEEIAKQEKAKEKKGSKPGGEKGKEESKKSTGTELQVKNNE